MSQQEPTIQVIEKPWFVGIPDPWIPENVVIYFDMPEPENHPEEIIPS